MSSDTAAIWAKLGKDLGGDVLFRASESVKLNWETVDYPSSSLGSAVGIWGLPLNGKITQFHGQENSGKTFFAMLMAKATLDKYPGSEVVWLDTELAFDRGWATKLGIDVSRVIVMSSNEAVTVFETLIGRFNDKGKKTTPGICDLIAEGKLNVKLFVLDSIANLIPPVEQGRNLADMEMAALARFLPKALRQLKPALSKAKAGMIVINQLRDSMTPGGQPSYPGGRTYKHSLDFAIKFHPSTSKDNTLFNAKGEKAGHMIIATIEKSRGSVNKHQAEFFLDFNVGVVRKGGELAELAAGYGVVQRPNNTTWIYKDHSVRGKDNFAELLDSTPALYAEIYQSTKSAQARGVEVNLELSPEAVVAAGGPADFSGDDDDDDETAE